MKKLIALVALLGAAAGSFAATAPVVVPAQSLHAVADVHHHHVKHHHHHRHHVVKR